MNNNMTILNNSNATAPSKPASKKRQRNYDFTLKAERLADDFAPLAADIVCGRGNFAVNHPGNMVFNEICRSSLDDYASASRRVDKSMVVASVLKEVTEDAGARFVKKHRNQWYQMTMEQAHDKIGHCIRDMIRGDEKEKKTSKSKEAIHQQSKPQIPPQKQQFQDILNLVLQNANADHPTSPKSTDMYLTDDESNHDRIAI